MPAYALASMHHAKLLGSDAAAAAASLKTFSPQARLQFISFRELIRSCEATFGANETNTLSRCMEQWAAGKSSFIGKGCQNLLGRWKDDQGQNVEVISGAKDLEACFSSSSDTWNVRIARSAVEGCLAIVCGSFELLWAKHESGAGGGFAQVGWIGLKARFGDQELPTRLWSRTSQSSAPPFSSRRPRRRGRADARPVLTTTRTKTSRKNVGPSRPLSST
mmetsp:Transcript_5365/g.17516  ORF Transcript_5365/g.17516 Transcript_5365/m.17516 type:complete len:220 (-) Transcript_5365:337-996(-)